MKNRFIIICCLFLLPIIAPDLAFSIDNSFMDNEKAKSAILSKMADEYKNSQNPLSPLKITQDKYNSWHDAAFLPVKFDTNTNIKIIDYEKKRNDIANKKVKHIPEIAKKICITESITPFGSLTDDNDFNGRKIKLLCNNNLRVYIEASDRSKLIDRVKTTYRPASSSDFIFADKKDDGYYSKAYMITPQNNIIIMIAYYPEISSSSRIMIQLYGNSNENGTVKNGTVKDSDIKLSEQILYSLKCHINNDQLRYKGNEVNCIN